MTSALRDDEAQYVDRIRVLADDVLLPAAHRLPEPSRYPEDFPQDAVDVMAEHGLFGTVIPRKYGGRGLSLSCHVAALEEVSRAWVSLAGVINPHMLCVTALLENGTEAQRQELLPRLASGELRAAISISEPHAGSDVQAITTEARPVSTGGYALHGRKRWITNGLGAGLVCVLARVDLGAQPPSKGMALFLVEKAPWVADVDPAWPGVTVPEVIDKMGDRGVETTDLALDGYLCPPDRVVGGPDGVGRGFQIVMQALETGRIGASSICVGVAQRCLDLSVARALDRVAFGRPIADHQSIQAHLADMATKVHVSRLVTRDAARTKDEGGDATHQAGMAKLFASESAKEVADSAFRIHGSDGYARGSEVERLFRDALSLISAEGPSEIQRLVIARSVLRQGREAQPGPAV